MARAAHAARAPCNGARKDRQSPHAAPCAEGQSPPIRGELGQRSRCARSLVGEGWGVLLREFGIGPMLILASRSTYSPSFHTRPDVCTSIRFGGPSFHSKLTQTIHAYFPAFLWGGDVPFLCSLLGRRLKHSGHLSWRNDPLRPHSATVPPMSSGVDARLVACCAAQSRLMGSKHCSNKHVGQTLAEMNTCVCFD